MNDAANKNDWIGETLSGGRYRVTRLLGEGGMASVYLAEGSQPQRLVAGQMNSGIVRVL